jgi:hypothetical protein
MDEEQKIDDLMDLLERIALALEKDDLMDLLERIALALEKLADAAKV